MTKTKPFLCYLFTDDVRYNIARMRMKKRDALKGSEDSHNPDFNMHANVRTGRRVALLPMDNVSVSEFGVLNEADDNAGDFINQSSERHRDHLNSSPGIMGYEDVTASDSRFVYESDKGSNGSEDEETWPPTKQRGGRRGLGGKPEMALLPGLNLEQMAALLQKHQGTTDDNDDETASVLSSVTE